MISIRNSGTVSLIISALFSLAYSLEYFIYMPNAIVSPSVITVPIYISRPPAIINFNFRIKSQKPQRFLLSEIFSEVALQIPNTENFFTKADVDIELYSCKSLAVCLLNTIQRLVLKKTYQIPLSESSHLIELFTSKNCYKPKEKLQITLFKIGIEEILNVRLSFNSSLEWINGKFLQQNIDSEQLLSRTTPLTIDLYGPSNNLIRNWVTNSKNKSLMVEFDLPANAPIGIWRVEYYFRKKPQNDYREIKIVSNDNRLLNKESKMLINIKHEDDVTINSKTIQFSVCAEYSSIRSVKGRLLGTICFKSTEEEQIFERPCLKFQSFFNGSDKCVSMNLKTDELELKNFTYAQQQNRMIISVYVIDNFSKNSHNFTYLGPLLVNSQYRIVFLSQPYFKSGLPYYGKLRTLKHNGKPFYNASVMIQCNTVNFPYNWGHYSKHSSDENGAIHFILSPPPKELSVITCDIEDLSIIEETYGTQLFYRPSITQTLERWKSMSRESLQLKLLNRKSITEGVEELELEIQSNKSLTDDLVILLIANGQIIRSRYIKNKELIKSSCHNRNDELGHYSCDKKTKEINCMKDWRGNNCLTPRCKGDCKNGICLKTNLCFCQYGWTGEFCDKCMTRKNCLHGYCKEGNDCICQAGWVGYNCDFPESETKNVKNMKKRIVKKSVPITVTDHSEIITTFTSNITWTIPLMITSLEVLVHSVSKNPSSAKLYLKPYEVYLDTLTTSDINQTLLSSLESRECISVYPRKALKLLVENLILIDSSRVHFQSSLYNTMISDQCTIPHVLNRINPQTSSMNSVMISDSSQTEQDFLNTIQNLNLFPITTMRIVCRTCPAWKILLLYNNLNLSLPEESKFGKEKSKNKTIIKRRFCGCTENCQSYFVNNLPPFQPKNEQYLLASICSKKPSQGNRYIFIKNQNLKIIPSFIVTISTINMLKVHEINRQEISIFNRINISLEIEISTKTQGHCLTNRLSEKILISIQPFESTTITQDIQFNCSGVFELLIIFKARTFGLIYPGLQNKDKDEITRTESVSYNVIDGVYTFKKFKYQFCQNEVENKSILIDFKEDFKPVNHISFTVNIQNSLESFLNHVKYIYRYRKLDNILALTLKIYEINLNKLLRNKRHLNQSLISIKKMLQVESKIIRNITKPLLLEYEILLINLCSDIPNLLYYNRRQFCGLVRSKLILKRKDLKLCSGFKEKLDGVLLIITMTLSSDTKSLFKISKNKLQFIKTCLKDSIPLVDNKPFEEIMKILKNDPLVSSELIMKENDTISLVHLAFLYVMVSDKPNSKPILQTISKILLRKLNQDRINFSKLNVILLLKLFHDYEERFQVHWSQEKSFPDTHVSKTFSSWSKNQKFELELPILYGCSNVVVKASYFSSMSWKENKDFVISVIQKKESCHSANLSIKFEKTFTSYKSLVVLVPTGWILDPGILESLIKEMSICNISISNEDRLFAIKFDFLLSSNKCNLETINLLITQYQQILNVQSSYIIASTKSNNRIYKSFFIKNCTNEPQRQIYYQNHSVDKTFLLKEFCQSYLVINLVLNKRNVTVESNSKVIIHSTGKSERNRISIVYFKKEIVEFILNETMIWFLKNYKERFCNTGKIINNLISQYSSLDENLTPRKGPYCSQAKTKSIINGYIYQLRCKGLIYLYKIKSIDLNKNLILLQSFVNKCDLNSNLNKEFQLTFIKRKYLSLNCREMLTYVKSSKNNLILFSPKDLKENLTLNFNDEILIIEL